MFLHREKVEGDLGIQVAFTDSSLDLGDRSPGRDLALAELGAVVDATPVIMRQVHGHDVYDATTPPTEPPVADGLICSASGVALLARAADCVPVLFADPGTGLIGAAHAGRGGVVTDVVGATVAALREAGAAEIHAWVGPHVCGHCYEVPATMRAEVAELVPETWGETRWHTPSLDLGAGVVAQLRAAGITEITRLDVCTMEDPRVHSHRRDADSAGRFAGLVWR